MKNVRTSDLLAEAALGIEKIAPKNSEIEIEVKEKTSGVFTTNIKLHTKYRTYFAKKEGNQLYASFAKALKAIKSQLYKKRTIRLKRPIALKEKFAT